MTVRFGLLGAGFIGAIHARALADSRSASLVAVAGGQRSIGLAAEHGVDREPSPEALLARRDIEAVIIATPHTTHLPLTVAAASAGKHVLVEKPMALTTADCDRMIAACRAAGVQLGVAHMTRFFEALRVARGLFERGELGEIRMIQGSRLVPGFEEGGWTLDPREGSEFASWGAHGCDIVRWFMGDPSVAFGRVTSFGGGPPNGLSAMCQFGFPGGGAATLWQSYEIAGTLIGARARYLIVGSEAVLEIHAYGQVSISRASGRETIFTAEGFGGPNAPMAQMDSHFRAAFRDQVDAFAESIRDGSTPPVTGEDGRAAVGMTEAVERSSREGRSVPMQGGTDPV